ncbi:MAG: oligosaccharyl transferase, archaeosortase A system-associated, partial [Dehalococcoidales bacterium]
MVKRSVPSLKLRAVILLALFFGIILFFRIYFPYDQVFNGELIKFTGIDAYYHMRLVDNLIPNFPFTINWDPYLLYPSGANVENFNFFDWLLAGIVRFASLGSPTQHTIDVIAVYYPTVLAALTVIPVYFVGRELFGRWAGILSAGLIAVMPGEFLGRSILGFTDHHVAETLFSTTAMMFLVMAIKTAREKGLTFNHIRHGDWSTIAKPIILSLSGGVFFATYLLTWAGALLFVFIIFIYFLIQFIIDHMRHQSTDYLCAVGVFFFLTALIIYAPVWREAFYLVPVTAVLFTPIALNIISRLIIKIRKEPVSYPLALVILGMAGLGIFYAVAPSLLARVLVQFSIFNPSGPGTIAEMQSFLFPLGEFSLQLAWSNLTTGFFISSGLLLYWIFYTRIYRKDWGSAEKNFLLIWSIVMLLAMLGQRRFAYYFAINTALLTGFVSWQVLKFTGFKEAEAQPQEELEKLKAKRLKTRREKRQKTGLTLKHLSMAIGAIAIFFLVFYPNIYYSVLTAKEKRSAPSDAWVSSLTWLRENTPEPFGDGDYYYKYYKRLHLIETFKYLESAYGVMAWGDYGYWISRIAHRPANMSPGPGGTQVAQFFVSQDEDSARAITEELDSDYVIIDDLTATTKFWALARWAGQDESQFFEVYFQRQEDKYKGVSLFYPEYYRSMVVRLYNFNGQAVTPQQPMVIAYEEKLINEGAPPVKLVTGIQTFSSYEDATAYISSQQSGNFRLVSDDPFISPVPLAPLEHYELIHSSDDSVS